MQFKAKILQLLPIQTGTGKNGTWKKQDIIVETTDTQYPRKICVSVWGDKINVQQFPIQSIVDISFEIESREFNTRWYTDVRAWKIELIENGVDLPLNSFEPLANTSDTNQEDDLPF